MSTKAEYDTMIDKIDDAIKDLQETVLNPPMNPSLTIWVSASRCSSVFR